MKKILVALVLLTAVIFTAFGCKDPVENPSTNTGDDPVNEYTVTFDVDGGTAVEAQKVKEGAKAIKPADPTKEGYTFAGWFVGETAYDFEAAVTGDVTLKAKWTENAPPAPEKYTVTFDTDGGNAIDAQTVEDGAKATKPADPTKEGYTFAGWFVGETAYDFETAVTGDVTVKAKWTQITYTVTFDTDGGSAVAAQTVAHGAKATKPADPTKEGYTFAGWFVGETAYDFASEVKTGVTVKAKWTQITYTVTFDTDGGSAVTAQTVAHGAKATVPVAPTKAGFAFVAWYLGENAYDFATPVTGDITLKATWKVDLPDLSSIAGTYTGKEQIMTMTNFYTFVINADGNIQASYETSSTTIKMTVNYVIFKDGKLTVNYTAGSTTKDMVFACSEAGKLVTEESVTGNKLTLFKNYTVTFDYNYDGASDPKTVTVEHGSTVKKESKSRTGYTLDGWFVGETMFDFDTPITSDMTFVAKWSAKKYTVTFYNQDGGVLKEFKVDYNHILTDSEIPSTGMITKDGYKFNGYWYSSATATSSQNLGNKITADKKYYPGVIAPMSGIAGTWKGTDSKGTAYTLVIDAATQTVTATLVNKDGVTDVPTIVWIYFKEFVGISGTNTKLVIKYKATGSTSETTLTLTYENESLTGSNSLTLEKEGVTKYTVTFDTKDGSAVEAQSVVSGSAAEEPANPTKEGFLFEGWYIGDVKYDFATPVTGDITLTAKWTASWTVNFDSDGGDAVESTTVNPGGVVTKPADPTKKNRVFMGWYLGENEYDFATPVTSDITLKAKWGVVVKFYNQSKTNWTEVIVEYGTKIPADKIPTTAEMDEGYIFTGVWHKKSSTQNTAAAFDFDSKITSSTTEICPGAIATSIKTLEGTWTGTADDVNYNTNFPKGTVCELTIDVDESGKVKITLKSNDVEWSLVSVQFNGERIVCKGVRPGGSTSTTVNIDYNSENGALIIYMTSTKSIALAKK